MINDERFISVCFWNLLSKSPDSNTIKNHRFLSLKPCNLIDLWMLTGFRPCQPYLNPPLLQKDLDILQCLEAQAYSKQTFFQMTITRLIFLLQAVLKLFHAISALKGLLHYWYDLLYRNFKTPVTLQKRFLSIANVPASGFPLGMLQL